MFEGRVLVIIAPCAYGKSTLSNKITDEQTTIKRKKAAIAAFATFVTFVAIVALATIAELATITEGLAALVVIAIAVALYTSTVDRLVGNFKVIDIDEILASIPEFREIGAKFIKSIQGKDIPTEADKTSSSELDGQRQIFRKELKTNFSQKLSLSFTNGYTFTAGDLADLELCYSLVDEHVETILIPVCSEWIFPLVEGLISDGTEVKVYAAQFNDFNFNAKVMQQRLFNRAKNSMGAQLTDFSDNFCEKKTRDYISYVVPAIQTFASKYPNNIEYF